jgi:hypothetical protein
MKLSEHVVDIEKRSAIESQVLADFIADWTESSNYTEGTVIDTPWQVHCDRAWGNFWSWGSSSIDVTFGHQAEICGTIAFHNINR